MAQDKKNRNYYKMFDELLEYSKQAVDYVQEELVSFNPDEEVMKKKLSEIHAIEHAADMKKHKLMQNLAKEFVTPIEREDIIAIADALDEVTDSLEEFFQKIYMYNIQEVPPTAMQYVSIISKCIEKLQIIYTEFHNFKKSEKIHDEIIALNALEEDGDDLYISAIRNLHTSGNDSLKIFTYTEIFDQLEKCCDRCEEAGDLISEVMMKNA